MQAKPNKSSKEAKQNNKTKQKGFKHIYICKNTDLFVTSHIELYTNNDNSNKQAS